MADESPDSLKAALRKIEIFQDLTEEQLDWFATNAEDKHYATGDVIIHGGEPADRLFVIIEGELRGRPDNAPMEAPVYIAHAGEVSGMLPYSRMVTFRVLARAGAPTRIAVMHKSRFDEMLQHIPQLLPRLIGVLADRIREFSRADQQRDKLMALGKLSAGLAHELNNPASSAKRAAESLRDAIKNLRKVSVRLDGHALPTEQRRALAELEDRTLERIPNLPALDSLEQSDLEDAITDWLCKRGIQSDARLAGSLADYGFNAAELEQFASVFGASVAPQVLHDVLNRLAAVSSVERLLHEIEGTTGRISELVSAIKEYSYMDQLPEQEVDLHHGIDSTLTMLKFRLKKGVTVTREYDKTLPRIYAHGSELNQVWTNLIDNAVDAMGGKGELLIRTARELDCALVEITDNGSGIPDNIREHIFEPFFTTKGVGEGTGLGLDTVYRIVRKHHGNIQVESKPGKTVFQVRIPFTQGAS